MRTELINERENALACEFYLNHECKSARGFLRRFFAKRFVTRSVTLTVESCGIGDAVSIRCDNCGQEKDLTDYFSW
jgi:hypothetical protein